MRTLDQIVLRPNERQAIQAAAATLRQHLPVTQVILFGSKARGDSGKDSDVDLLLLTEHRFTWEERGQAVELLLPLELQHDLVFSPVDVPADEWFHGLYQALPLRNEVERDGVAT